ncbi:MAG: chorismate mutase [Actinomycetota bacterium]|jgi:chorismate mutase|nr:chorismate mutase [Actinomycetota bacterium]
MNRLAAEDITDVAAGRAVIDDLDARILRLVAERRDASRRIQHLRRVAGSPGIQYARENEIIGRYTSGLGSAGARLALMVLELCRGDQATAVHSITT